MSHLEFMTEPWIVAWGDALRASESYRRAAATWEGALVVRVDADARRGLPETRAAFLDLRHGDCLAARAAIDGDVERSRYLIRGSADNWQKVLSRTVDPLFALMTRKLVLERGSLAQLTPYASAAKELVLAAMTVPTRFPAGW